MERLKEVASCHHKVRHCDNPTSLSNGNQWQSERHGKRMAIITSDPYWNAESSWNTETSAGVRTADLLWITILSFFGSNCDRFMARFSGSKI